MNTEPNRDPILDLGKDPILYDVDDASENLDHYIYIGQGFHGRSVEHPGGEGILRKSISKKQSG